MLAAASAAWLDAYAWFWSFETSVWTELAALVFVLWVLRYLLIIVKPPALYHTPTMFSDKLIAATPGLLENFWPTIWLSHGWLQSLWSIARRHRKPITWQRELLDVTPLTPAFYPGQIAIDWAVPTPKIRAKFRDEFDEAVSPIIIIFHGLSGGSQEPYVLAMANRLLNEAPRRVVVVNARGCGGLRLKTPQAYCAAYTEDHRQAIAHIAKQYPHAPLFGIGFSLGANIMSKLMGEDGAYCLLSGALCVGTPFCILRGIASLECTWWRKWMFSFPLAYNLANLFASEAPAFKGTKLEEPFRRLHSLRSLSEFDQTITAPMFNYNSVDHYYGESSVQRYIPNIQRPLLYISAEDDPIVRSSTIPYIECKNNAHIILAVTKSGGHSMDHFTGFRPQSWNALIASQFFTALAKQLPPHLASSHAVLREALARPPAETVSKLYHPLSLAHYMQPLHSHQSHPQHALPQLDPRFLAAHQGGASHAQSPTKKTTTAAAMANARASSDAGGHGASSTSASSVPLLPLQRLSDLVTANLSDGGGREVIVSPVVRAPRVSIVPARFKPGAAAVAAATTTAPCDLDAAQHYDCASDYDDDVDDSVLAALVDELIDDEESFRRTIERAERVVDHRAPLGV